jgi:tetratricopeptide (TPR) repeat protein
MLASRDLKECVELSAAAAEHVPELPELREIAAFYQGIACLQEDHCEQALACFAKCDHLQGSWPVADLKRQAMQGAAFDRKDYDQFLQLAEEAAKRDPNDPMATACVASALACQYAVHGDVKLREMAEAKLEEAKKLGGDVFKESNYEERIRYRLQTREIIDSKEFQRRFPNGWKPSGASRT